MTCKHNFVHAQRETKDNGKLVVIYCTNCGLVSFDQAATGIKGEYQQMLTKHIIVPPSDKL